MHKSAHYATNPFNETERNQMQNLTVLLVVCSAVPQLQHYSSKVPVFTRKTKMLVYFEDFNAYNMI